MDWWTDGWLINGWMNGWIYVWMDGWTNLYAYVYCNGYVSKLLKQSTLQLQLDLPCQPLQLLQHVPLQQQIHCKEMIMSVVWLQSWYTIKYSLSPWPSTQAIFPSLVTTQYCCCLCLLTPTRNICIWRTEYPLPTVKLLLYDAAFQMVWLHKL